MSALKDLTNEIFGTWQVIKQVESRKGKVYWECKCVYCNSIKNIQGGHLRNGQAANCNCHPPENNNHICKICNCSFLINNSRGINRIYCYNCVPEESENFGHAQVITAKRRAIKKMLVERAGGKCQKCGYNKSIRALDFHHTNPKEKEFGISRNLTKNLEDLKREADKCILLCANCHAEEHELLETLK